MARVTCGARKVGELDQGQPTYRGVLYVNVPEELHTIQLDGERVPYTHRVPGYRYSKQVGPERRTRDDALADAREWREIFAQAGQLPN